MNSIQPKVSVIVSTFNWSAALRCALASISSQTFTDFEALVIGDGCTDDSEAIVAACNDPRFKWHNLDRNYGSQWAPNNYGLATAAGEWIAYLGQDDVWHPSHLDALVRTALERDADWVASVMISYGPPDSGIRALSGLFLDGVSPATEFTPPSSVMHRKSLVDRIGPWRDPETIAVPPDCEFQQRAIEAGALVASTNELTAFKFNAAWRRDSYLLKPTSEQEGMLAKLRAGSEFRHGELIDALKAVIAEKFVLMKMPDPAAAEKGRIVKGYGKFKGAHLPYGVTELREIKARERFFLPSVFAAFEWHNEEHDSKFGPFRWSGPSRRASVDLPIRFKTPLEVVVHMLQAIEPRQLETLRFFINNTPVQFKTEVTADRTHLLSALAIPSKPESQAHGLRVSLEVERPQRPKDLGHNADGRWLGVAINWIEVSPATSLYQ